jgi:hypothetical protein
MQYRIEDGRLILTVDDEERELLRQLKAERQDDEQCDPWGSDALMYDWFEPLICNSELDWVDPAVTGDLTSAPILAIRGDYEPGPDNVDEVVGTGLVHAGCWEREGRLRQMYLPVLFRWAYMDYQVRYVLDDLLDQGEAVFTGGPLLSRPEPTPA